MQGEALRQLIQDNAGTDAEIHAIAQADKRTVAPIPLSLLVPFVADRSLTSRFDAAQLRGDVPAELKAGLVEFNRYIFSPHNQVLDTTDPVRAARIIALVGAAVVFGVITNDEAAGIVALGGGYRTADATIDDVAQARASLVREEAIATVARQWADFYNAGAAAIDAARTGGNVPTLDELKAQ